jgi:hypothetical protein
MRREDVREFGAIPIVVVLLGILAVILWAANAGMWMWIVVGVVVLVAILAFALIYMARPHHPAHAAAPSLPAGAARRVDDGVHRTLVIADDACAPEELGRAIANLRTAAPAALFVVAPALGSRTARWTGDEHAYQDAAAHLDATLRALRELQVEADGRVGSHDPLQAADDGLREFPADEIVFAVQPGGDANWLQRGVVELARGRYALPVSEIAVTRPAAPRTP